MRSLHCRLCLFCLAALLAVSAAAAQTEKDLSHLQQKRSPAARKSASIDINNIELWISNAGHLGYDPEAGGYQGLYYPAGQRDLSILYTGGLWLVGDVNGSIRSASVQYSTEYQPGPILPDGTAPDPENGPGVFKFNRPLRNAPSPVTEEAIDLGCPREVLGDQMLYTVFNDLGSHQYLNDTDPLGVEVQQTVWGYDVEGALANVVYCRYRIINKGGNQINDAYLALFYDPDIGDSNDDAMGADSVLGLIFGYNGDAYDARYGTQVPAYASDFFQGPVVDAPGKTAVLNDGTILANKKILRQTAAFHFV